MADARARAGRPCLLGKVGSRWCRRNRFVRMRKFEYSFRSLQDRFAGKATSLLRTGSRGTRWMRIASRNGSEAGTARGIPAARGIAEGKGRAFAGVHGLGIIKSRAEPSRAEPSRAEPSRAEPSRAEPSRAEPSLNSGRRPEPASAAPARGRRPDRPGRPDSPHRFVPRCGHCGAGSEDRPRHRQFLRAVSPNRRTAAGLLPAAVAKLAATTLVLAQITPTRFSAALSSKPDDDSSKTASTAELTESDSLPVLKSAATNDAPARQGRAISIRTRLRWPLWRLP